MNQPNKIKVLQVCGGLSTEGIGVFLVNTFENINKDKFIIDFAIATKYEQLFEERIKNQNGRIFKTYEIGDGLLGKLKHFINLYKLIKKEKYDVVHSHMDFFNGFNMFVAFIAGVPLRISHSHLANNRNISFSQKIYYFLMRILILMFSNKKLGCSLEANHFINRGGKIIYNGIDINKFKNEEKEIPSDISFANNQKRIITVGRIDNQKNPFFIVDIIYELSKIADDFHFYWIGFGSLYNDVKTNIDQLNLNNYITLLGTRNDVHKILKNMSVFILPSKYEGFGIVLAEAQVAGLKCFMSENVPSDVNIGLCEVINLSDGAEIWAKKIDAYFNTEEKKITKLDLNKIDIKKTILTLQNEYLTK